MANTDNKELFNIDLLILNNNNIKFLKEISSSNIFVSSTKEFDPNGLFSTVIFGEVGSKERSTNVGYINLNTNIIHPVIFEILIKLHSYLPDLLSGRKKYLFNTQTNDFEENPEGYTGYNYFYKYIDKLNFEYNQSSQREFRINLMKKYLKQEYLIDKWLVIPAGLRDYTIDKKGTPSEDEINPLYRTLLNVSNLLKNINTDYVDALDPIKYKIQLATFQIFDHLRSLLKGKHKFIEGKWTKRAVLNGTRNVITPSPTKILSLKDKNNITMNHTTLGLYQYLKAILPIVIHRVHSLYLDKFIDANTDIAMLVNPKTLKTEDVNLPIKVRDEWLTVDGMNNIINKLKQPALRLEPVKINGYYLALILDEEDTITFFYNTNDIPEHIDITKLRPITYAELFYLSVCDIVDKYPGFLTRYPVTGLGGIYPTLVYLKTTNKSRTINYIDNYTNKVVREYPVLESSFVESLSPARNHLELLGADHDGDSLLGSVFFKYYVYNGESQNTYNKENNMPLTDKKNIVTNYGFCSLKDFPKGELIKKKGNIEFYKVPDNIEVLTIWDNKELWVKPESFSIHKKLEMLAVKTNRSNTVECSKDHSLVTVDCETLEYKRTNPEVGMCIPRKISTLEKYLKPEDIKRTIVRDNITFILDEELGWFYGAIIGDGWVNKTMRYNDVMFANVCKELRENINNIFVKYGYTKKPCVVENHHEFNGRASYSEKTTWTYEPIAYLFHNVTGYGALNKQLPEWWAMTTDEFRLGLLSGLIDTDGTIAKNSIDISTSSYKLAYGVIGLCNSLGIVGALTIHKRHNRDNFEYTVRINKSSVLKIKSKLKLRHPDRIERINRIVETNNKYDSTLKTTINVSINKVKELRQYFISINDIESTNRTIRALEKAKPIIGTYFSLEGFKEIWNKHHEVLSKDTYWNRVNELCSNPDIEWEVITNVVPLPEITEAYDLTTPPYNTFVIQNGIVAYDTCSLNIVYTEDAIKEINNYLNNNKSNYVNIDNTIVYSSSNAVVDQVVNRLTQDPV